MEKRLRGVALLLVLLTTISVFPVVAFSAEKTTVLSVEQLSDIVVDKGTLWQDLSLPTSVQCVVATEKGEEEKSLSLMWNHPEGTIEESVICNASFVEEVELAEGVEAPSVLVSVTVSELQNPLKKEEEAQSEQEEEPSTPTEETPVSEEELPLGEAPILNAPNEAPAQNSAETISMTVSTSILRDFDNEWMLRPSELTLVLYADGERVLDEGTGEPVTRVVSVDSQGTCTQVTFDNLPKESEGNRINYSIEVEPRPTCYMPDVKYETDAQGNITADLAMEFIYYDYTLSALWKDDDNALGARPTEYPLSLTIAGVTRVFDMKESEGWTKKIIIPGQNKDGDELTSFNFRISGVSYVYSYGSGTTTCSGNNGSFDYTFRLSYSSEQFRIYWDDAHNQYGSRPTTATIMVRDNEGNPAYGQWPKTVTMDYEYTEQGEAFTQAWINLLRFTKDNQRQNYTVEWLDAPANYEVSRRGSSTYFFNAVLPTTRLESTVTWDDDNNARQNRPSEVYLTLMKDGAPNNGGKNTVSVTSAQPTTVFDNLPKYDETGEEIQWSVRESFIPKYDTSYEPVVFQDGTFKADVRNIERDDWNYSLDLRWDETDVTRKYDILDVLGPGTISSRSYKYVLSISTNARSYEAGDLQIRLPYALWKYRNSDSGAVPGVNDISVDGAGTGDYSFSYVIDDKGTTDLMDDEIVFSNHTRFEAGSNHQLSVIYRVNVAKTVDLSKITLQAKGLGKGDGQAEFEEVNSAEISLQIDTGAEIYIYDSNKKFQKNIYFYHQLPYLVKEDRTQFLEADFHLDQYNYVLYDWSASIKNNQPATLILEERPSDGGVLVAAYNNESSRWSMSGNTYTLEFVRDAWVYQTVNGRFLIAYPKPDIPDPAVDPGGQATKSYMYTNELFYDLYANDDENYLDPSIVDLNDRDEYTVSVDSTWSEYVYHWDGEIYAHSKNFKHLSQNDAYELPAMDAGKEQGGHASVSFTANGYELGEYQMEVYDSDLYWTPYLDTDHAWASDSIRMTAEDYYVSACDVRIVLSQANRETMEIIPRENLPTEPFQVFGMNANEEWALLQEIVPTSADGVYTVSSDWFTSKQYTGIRVLSPDNTTEGTTIHLEIDYMLKLTSPSLQKWIAEDKEGTTELLRMDIRNFASFRLFQKRNGRMYWLNPGKGGTAFDEAQDVGLYNRDLAQYGKRVEHKYDMITFDNLYYNNYAYKKYLSITNDPAKRRINTVFGLGVTEEYGYEDCPDHFFEEMSFDSGTFYDLLPEGYRFREDITPTINAVSGVPALITNVEVIDNFRNSGRQMVIFTVESLAEAGHNYGIEVNYPSPFRNDYVKRIYTPESGKRVTGFAIAYTASIMWEDWKPRTDNFNVCAFQRNDGKPLHGRRTSQLNYSAPHKDQAADFTYQLPAELLANNPFYDVNGDGVVEEYDTLYLSTQVDEDVAISTETGITKRVKPAGGNYDVSTKVPVGGDYSYKITLNTAPGGVTNNIVFYDLLEEAANTEGHSGETAWKGSFQRVDVSMLIGAGAAPVVYYSTVTGLNDNDFDHAIGTASISNTEIWSTTPPADLSTVTAIAVDIRKAADNSDFQLENHHSIYYEILMKAPDELYPEVLAYNRPAYQSTFVASGTVDPITSTLIGKRVTVQLYEPQDLLFQKIGEAVNDKGHIEGTKPLPGVQFALYRCTNMDAGHVHTGRPGQTSSCWGQEYFSTQYSKEDGTVCFPKLDTGHYALVELQGRSEYNSISGYWTCSVDADRGTITSLEANGSTRAFEEVGGVQTLQNDLKRTSIRFVKEWVDDAASAAVTRPAMLSVDLYRNDEKIDTIQIPSNKTEVTVIDDLPLVDDRGQAYTYRVEEQTVAGYTAAVSTVGTAEEPVTKFTNTLENALTIKKVLASQSISDDAKAQEFTFQVELTNAAGEAVDAAVTLHFTDVQGVSVEGKPDQQVSSTNGILTVQGLKADQMVTLLGLPEDVRCTVTEQEVAGYTDTATAAHQVSFTQGQMQTMTIENRYEAKADVAISGSKTVNGRTPLEGETFFFTMEAADNKSSTRKQTSNELGGFAFTLEDEILVTKPGETGTRWFTISEAATAGFETDSTVYYLEVSYSDNGNGTISTTQKLHKGTQDGPVVEALSFANTLPLEASYRPTVTKTLDGMAPGAKTFRFTLEGEGHTQTVTNDREGTVSFEELSFTQEDIGKTFRYQVREESVGDPLMNWDETIYTLTISPTEEVVDGEPTLVLSPQWTKEEVEVDAVTFTNTTWTTASVQKQWDDADNTAGKRPDAVVVSLYANGTQLQTVRLNEENDFFYEVTQLPKYKDGQEIVYAWVEEQTGEDYVLADTTVEGTHTVFTNRYEPGTTSRTIKKIWEDQGNADKKRPTSIPVSLYQNNVLLKTVTLSETNGWTLTISDLPIALEGTTCVYTFREEPVSGYTCSSVQELGDTTLITNTRIPVREVPKTSDVFPMGWMGMILFSAAGILRYTQRRRRQGRL